MMRTLYAATVLLALFAGCKREASPPAPTAPIPVVRTSSAAAFAQTREGPRPAFSKDGLFVFVSPAAADLDLGLPGLAFGDTRGPRYGLLGGYYAPQVLAPRAAAAYRSEVELTKDSLRVRYLDDRGAVALDAAVRVDARGPRVVLRGPSRLAMPADRVEVYGTKGGAPAFSRPLTAGEEPAVDTRGADRVEVRSAKHGGHVFETSCPRVHIVSPVLRGSTSVFVLATGAGGPPEDPLYAPPPPAEGIDPVDCPGTVTSTLWLPTPG